eukprot:12731139-Ditylum_brightwellii.AAC.1
MEERICIEAVDEEEKMVMTTRRRNKRMMMGMGIVTSSDLMNYSVTCATSPPGMHRRENREQ